MANNYAERISTRKFWSEFIKMYRESVALWDPHQISSRHEKQLAYNALIAKLRKIQPEADQSDVRRRINIFRTNYRRERTRILRGERDGLTYAPSLWYYDMMSFLDSSVERRGFKRCNRPGASKEQKLRGEKKHSATSVEEKSDTPYVPEDRTEADKWHMPLNDSAAYENGENCENQISALKNLMNNIMGPKWLPDTPAESKNDNLTTFMLSPKVELREGEQYSLESSPAFVPQQVAEVPESPEAAEVQNPPNEISCEAYSLKEDALLYANGSQTTERDSMPMHDMPAQTKEHCRCCAGYQQPVLHAPSEQAEADILAKSWALQYNEMSGEQKVFARKAISDILFQGCMGKLGSSLQTTSFLDTNVNIHNTNSNNSK